MRENRTDDIDYFGYLRDRIESAERREAEDDELPAEHGEKRISFALQLSSELDNLFAGGDNN